ncbi:MAG: DUF2141 domain-containing protein [Bacteroidota bacterium]
MNLLILLFTLTSFTEDITVIKDKSDSKSQLAISITGLRANKGQIVLALDNDERNYKSKKDCFKGYFLKVENNQANIIIEDLPTGEYAIKVYHDVNNNGKLDKNMIGVPSEPYAFSNNAKGFLGIPDFDEVKFPVREQREVVTISF